MEFNVSNKTRDFIHGLPKTETHLHIEGALPYHLLRSIDPILYEKPQACWATDYVWENFEAFEKHLIDNALKWFTSAERYYEAAQSIFAEHQRQNVRYVETSFHAGMIELLGISGREILAAIRSAAPSNLEVRVFLGMSRNSYTQKLGPVLEDALSWEGLSGFDLHGLESLPLEPWTEHLWRKARDHGLVTKAHAGEFGPAANVREAIELLGVSRIEHGVRAIEDPSVIEFAIDNNISFDICPISNVKLGVVKNMYSHPIRYFYDKGLRCTVSTDDPFSFGNCLEDEYAALSSACNFNHDQLKQIARNGFDVALLDDSTRSALIAEFI